MAPIDFRKLDGKHENGTHLGLLSLESIPTVHCPTHLGFRASETVCEPFKRGFSICHSPLSLDSTPVGLQTQLFRGLVYEVQVLKVGVPDLCINLSLLKDKLWVL